MNSLSPCGLKQAMGRKKYLFILKSMNSVDMVRPVSYTHECSMRPEKRLQRKPDHLEEKGECPRLEFLIWDCDLKAWWDYGDRCVCTDAERLVRDCTYKTNLRRTHKRLARNQTFKSILSATTAQSIHTGSTAVSSKWFTEKSYIIQITRIVIQRYIDACKTYFFPCISNHTPVLLNIFLFLSFLFHCWQLERFHSLHSSIPLRSCQKRKCIRESCFIFFFWNNFH